MVKLFIFFAYDACSITHSQLHHSNKTNVSIKPILNRLLQIFYLANLNSVWLISMNLIIEITTILTFFFDSRRWTTVLLEIYRQDIFVNNSPFVLTESSTVPALGPASENVYNRKFIGSKNFILIKTTNSLVKPWNPVWSDKYWMSICKLWKCKDQKGVWLC